VLFFVELMTSSNIKQDKEIASKAFNSISNEIILSLSSKIPSTKDSNFIGEILRPFVL